MTRLKKAGAVLLLVLFTWMMPPLSAQAADKDRIVDDADKISAGMLTELNGYARGISDRFALDVVCILTEDIPSGQTLGDYARGRFAREGFGPDGLLLIDETDGSRADVYAFGRMERLLTDRNADLLWDAYDEADTYSGGVRAYLQEAEDFLASLGELGAPAADGSASSRGARVSADDELYFVEDAARLLSDTQWRALETKAEAIARAFRCEVRIIIVDDMRNYGYYDPGDLAYEIYATYGLGYGADRDCLILTLSMDDRDYDLRVWGTYGNRAFTLYGIDTLLDRHILPLLRNNDYYGAFSVYLDQAEAYLQMAEVGAPFDRRTDLVAMRRTFQLKLAVTILVPLLCAWITCSVWKAQMKTARIAGTAFNYIPAGGFRLANQSDIYLYRTRTRTRIQKSSSGSGRASSGGSGGSSGRRGKF